MALIDRIKTGPLPFEPTDHDAFDDLITGLREIGAEDVADRIASDHSLTAFFTGVLQGSDYLREMTLRESALVAKTLEQSPQARFADLLETAKEEARDAADMREIMRLLRRLKEDASLVIALSDLSGVWDVVEVIQALSDLAETALNIAIDWLLAKAIRDGKYAPSDPDNPSIGSGLIVLGMGKFGAGELNFSSDIDIIVFYDPDIAPLSEGTEAAAFFNRLVKDIVKLMQERTMHGYVFRTDLRLRPDPGATAPAISIGAALQYYESLAQNWERAAMIKARPVAGDRICGEGFLKEISPFVWRKHMDFAALADVHAMKRQINAHKGHGDFAVAGHNIKLGRGGIREIEFFVQTQQLIAGGRNPALRCRKTLDALAKLREAGWLDEEARAAQDAAYKFLRGLEHRIQMLADEQTHLMPSGDEALARFARFCGYEDAPALQQAVMDCLRGVSHHYANLFEDSPELSSSLGNLVFTGDDDDPETLETLRNLGFDGAVSVSGAIRSWHYGRYNAVRSAKAREVLTEITPALLEAFARSAHPDAAFLSFDRFVQGLPAGVQLFSMLRSNPKLLDLIAMIMGTAPRLSDIVAFRPHILDAILEPGFFNRLPDAAEIEQARDQLLGQARDYEDFLDRARIFGQGQSFLIGVRILTGNLKAEDAGRAYAVLADKLISAVAERALEEIKAQHGAVKDAEYAVLAMGRLGSCEMTATSDLDLIVIYDFDGETTASTGPREISPSQYFARYTQRFVAALSAPTSEGTLYEVDMRLRPSGNKGPVATHIDSFAAYQAEEAWTWEHMALTRSRVVAGSQGLARRIDDVRQAVLAKERENEKLRDDIASMRGRIEAEKGSANVWDFKLAPGGLTDIEFIIQYLELREGGLRDAVTAAEKLQAIRDADWMADGDAQILQAALGYYQNLMQLLRLCISGNFDPQNSPKGFEALIASAVDEPDFARVEARLVDYQNAVRAIFVKLIGPVGEAVEADA